MKRAILAGVRLRGANGAAGAACGPEVVRVDARVHRMDRAKPAVEAVAVSVEAIAGTRDIHSLPPRERLDARPLVSWVGGRIVYDAAAGEPAGGEAGR